MELAQYKKYAPYLAIGALVAFIAYDKWFKLGSNSDFLGCEKVTLKVFDTEIQTGLVDVPLAHAILEPPVVRAPAQNDLEKLARNVECGLHRDVSFMVVGRVKNTSSEKGVFNVKFTVEMDGKTTAKDFVTSRELGAGEDGLFATEVFQAKCKPEPIVKKMLVEPPSIKKEGQTELKVEKHIEAPAFKVKKERKIVILRNSPSFDGGAESEFKVKAGDTLIYLGEHGVPMIWAKEGSNGQFLRVRTLNASNPLWIFSSFVSCLKQDK
jgi:hypothetical protein